MRMDLRAPCANCPFRSDVHPFLHPMRVRDIADALLSGKTFTCHKHITGDDIEDENGEAVSYKPGAGDQHCAGAMIMLWKMERPNQIMQVGERLGLWDPARMKMDAPVFDTAEEMIEANSANARQRKS